MKIIQITENMSHTSKRLHDIEKEKGVTPGTPEWFKLWFNLPYLKESITEAFDNPYKFKVTHKSGDRWEAQSLTDNNVIIFFLASNVDTGWGIDFKTADADNPTNTTYDLTGKGDGQRTMTTVLAMLKQFISQYSPEEIYFDAAKDAGNSRTSLYQKLLQRFAGGLGYKVDVKDKGSRDDFTLVKIDETAFNESLDNPYQYKWDDAYNGDNSFLAKAETDMGELMVMFTVGKPGVSWTIDFAVDGAMDKTGDGDQFKIFATVVAVIKDWAANKVDLSKVTQIDFSSDKDGAAEDSRSKLYKRFGQQLASKLGWNLEITDRGQFASFKIKNPNAPAEITESLNNPYPFELIGPNDAQEFSALAQTPNGMLRMDFSSIDYDNFGIDFSVGTSMGKTDAGDEFRVFATVVAMMKKWIKTVGIESVESFEFGADKTDHTSDGRAKLYTRFAKQLASRLGWKLEQNTAKDDGTAFFKLTNPNPVPREQEYWDALEEEVEVSLHGDAEKGYVLSKIEVSGDERNAGQGTKAMQDIVDRMDREGAIIALTPDDAFGGNKNRLIKFYKRFGFVPNKGRNKDFRFRETMIRYPQTNESVNEETGEEMLSIFQNMHHDAGANDEMDAFIKSHDWKLTDFTPDMFPSEEEFFDYDDPFGRVIDIDYHHRVDMSQPIIVGPQYKDGKYSVIDGNHRAAKANELGKTIKGYFPYPQTNVEENFADGKKKGKSRPGRVKRSGASCNGSVTELRAKAKKASGEKAKMYHWCANMKAGKKK